MCKGSGCPFSPVGERAVRGGEVTFRCPFLVVCCCHPLFFSVLFECLCTGSIHSTPILFYLLSQCFCVLLKYNFCFLSPTLTLRLPLNNERPGGVLLRWALRFQLLTFVKPFLFFHVTIASALGCKKIRRHCSIARPDPGDPHQGRC